VDADGQVPQAKKVCELARCVSERAVGRGDPGVTGEADQADHDVTQRSHDAWLAGPSDTRSVLTVSYVPDIM
jgi:hypothetical protein